MKKAVVIGATSGIGRALTLELSRRGYAVGIAGRREALLQELQGKLERQSAWKVIDVAQVEDAVLRLQTLIAELGGMDLLVICAGIGDGLDAELDWEKELALLQTNVIGFARLAVAGYNFFSKQQSGHLVGISSIAGIRGSRSSPGYSASKAFMMNYLEALRWRAVHDENRITVTDIRPGFIATPMTDGQQGMFWVAPVEKAARQIADAIERRSSVAYITYRWALIATLLRHIPDWVGRRF
jgi:short-subunit dehydrogenase